MPQSLMLPREWNNLASCSCNSLHKVGARAQLMTTGTSSTCPRALTAPDHGHGHGHGRPRAWAACDHGQGQHPTTDTGSRKQPLLTDKLLNRQWALGSTRSLGSQKSLKVPSGQQATGNSQTKKKNQSRKTGWTSRPPSDRRTCQSHWVPALLRSTGHVRLMGNAAGEWAEKPADGQMANVHHLLLFYNFTVFNASNQIRRRN